MCDVGMKEAIEKLVKAIEIASLEVLKPKEVTVNPFLYEPIQTPNFNTEPQPEPKTTIDFYDAPKTVVDSDRIRVLSIKDGGITFNNDSLSFDLGVALEHIKKGLKVCRKGWNGKGMFVQCQVPDEFSKMTQAYAYITAEKKVVPWTPSQEDIFATDWMIYIGK